MYACFALNYIVPPKVVIYTPAKAIIGSNISINCTILKGQPPPDVSIITPKGEVINESVLSFTVTMEDAGNYTCVANNSVATITITNSLTVYGVYWC